MQSVSSRFWTRVVVSISYDDNHYTTGTSHVIIDLISKLLNQKSHYDEVFLLCNDSKQNIDPYDTDLIHLIPGNILSPCCFRMFFFSSINSLSLSLPLPLSLTHAHGHTHAHTHIHTDNEKEVIFVFFVMGW